MAEKLVIAPVDPVGGFREAGGEEVRAVTAAGADWIHVDVMDGHFVPNITIGPDVVRAIRPHSDLPFDVHLMIAPVDLYLEAFAKAGADHITVHAEAGPHLHRSLQVIRGLGKKAGVVICPATPPDVLEYVLDTVDIILVMTVNPGFGGQAFIGSQLEKIRVVRAMIGERHIRLQVDGGVSPLTAADCIEAGGRHAGRRLGGVQGRAGGVCGQHRGHPRKGEFRRRRRVTCGWANPQNCKLQAALVALVFTSACSLVKVVSGRAPGVMIATCIHQHPIGISDDYDNSAKQCIRSAVMKKTAEGVSITDAISSMGFACQGDGTVVCDSDYVERFYNFDFTGYNDTRYTIVVTFRSGVIESFKIGEAFTYLGRSISRETDNSPPVL